MSEYLRELAEQWPCAFSNQPSDLHADFVLGSAALTYVDQVMESQAAGDIPYYEEYIEAIGMELGRVYTAANVLLKSKDPWDVERAEFIQEHYAHVTDPQQSSLALETPLPDHLPAEEIRANVLRWMTNTTGRDLLDFLQWNEQRLRPVQQRLVERTAHSHAFILRDIRERLVDTGVLPAHVLTDDIMERAMQATMVHVMDPFTETGSGGYFSKNEAPVIGILDRYVDDDDRLYHALFHEYVHSIGLYVRTLRYQYGEDPDFEAIAENEAFVEHITVAALYGNPRVMEPSLRGDDGVYTGQRGLMSIKTIASGITVTELSTAFCEPLDSTTTPHFDRLNQKNHAASRRLFPELTTSLGKIIAREYNKAQSPWHREEVVRRWTAEIARRAGG